MYLGDVDEKTASVKLIEERDRCGSQIADPQLKVKLLFNKTGYPGRRITIEKDGKVQADEELPQEGSRGQRQNPGPLDCKETENERKAS
jgi:hypothetical protein